VNRPADLKACTCKAARLRLPSAGWRPFLPTAAAHAGRQLSARLPHSAKVPGITGVRRRTPFQRNAILMGYKPRRAATPNLPMHPLSYNRPRALPASPYASHTAIAFEPAPFGSHCTLRRRRSVGLLSLDRTRIFLAAGAALRSSWCWPRSASYATPR
jgi:hypothetical protein